ncbi:HNH endonuclease signature motif containing protein [uncultured Arcticibacterium sp.]|uniref:HNH endonuclease n=1 Tax=uncultured Arcticibacterium sp. TaxID=2173042 RepID=UPI0030F7E84F
MRRNWTKEELILAFNLYLKIPFGKMHKHNPDIIVLANLIGRTPSSISMRLGNFASVDPYHQERGISGLKGGKKQVQPIWDEFFNNQEELIFLSEEILARKENISLEDKYQEQLYDLKGLIGETVLRTVKTRVNQSVFRQMVLANYNSKCAITGIEVPELLLASHIIPWSKNEKERLNPENGLCLSATFDKAFDRGFIGIDSDLTIIFSPKLKEFSKKNFFNETFEKHEGHQLAIPSKYPPNQEFIKYHLDHIFNK